MKNFKFLLPMLAFVFAIGVAFTAPEMTEEPTVLNNDYILVNGTWKTIAEQDCIEGNFSCRVQLGVNGLVYEVYDLKDISTLKMSSAEKPTVIPPPQ